MSSLDLKISTCVKRYDENGVVNYDSELVFRFFDFKEPMRLIEGGNYTLSKGFKSKIEAEKHGDEIMKFLSKDIKKNIETTLKKAKP